MLSCTLPLIASAAILHPVQAGDPITVRDVVTGCYMHDAREYAWAAEEDGSFTRGAHVLTAGEVLELRRVLLGARTEPPNLLALAGITPDSVALHRDEILAVAMPAGWRESNEELPAELEYLLHYDHVAPHALNELRGLNWTSTTSFEFHAVIPGEPRIEVVSQGLTPWMLPWTVTAGEETWTVADIGVSHALLAIADPEGPCAEVLDGRAYWTTGFWSDRTFWSRFVGTELDSALSREAYVHFEGYSEFAARFQVDDVRTGHINMQGLAMQFDLLRRTPSAIDEVRWWNLIEDEQPSSDWNDLLNVYDAAHAAVAGQAWLLDWKNAGPERTIGLDAVGTTGFSETMMDVFVHPIWADAGLAGEPEFELLLRRDGKWCGTIYLSSAGGGALVKTARQGPGSHWFDAQDFSFHPRSKPPTYGRVDASGKFELRTLEAQK